MSWTSWTAEGSSWESELQYPTKAWLVTISKERGCPGVLDILNSRGLELGVRAAIPNQGPVGHDLQGAGVPRYLEHLERRRARVGSYCLLYKTLDRHRRALGGGPLRGHLWGKQALPPLEFPSCNVRCNLTPGTQTVRNGRKPPIATKRQYVLSQSRHLLRTRSGQLVSLGRFFY